jgi:tetratricopeptide (TPR) repeat protein
LSGTPNNLGLYRLTGFSGRRTELLALHEWLTGGDDLPAVAVSGEQGNGKSSLLTAVAWNHFYHFSDGIIRVGPAGANPFRLYDVVRTMDTVLGTALTRMSDDRWGISILEQLYKRKRLLILDKLAGGTDREIATLVEIIGHLHENEGQSRIVLIDRNFQPAVAGLVQFQHLPLGGIGMEDMPEFIWKRAPEQVRAQAGRHAAELNAITGGSPMCLRLLFGLLLDYSWEDLEAELRGMEDTATGDVSARTICALAVENYALQNPAAAVFLNRLVHGVGGLAQAAVEPLFWSGLGDSVACHTTVDALVTRGLLELDLFNERIAIHPVVRRYLEENMAMLGEEWDRRHAAYYVNRAKAYQHLPLHRWAEVDMDWGNIYIGADWCARRVDQIWQQSAQTIVADPQFHPDQLPRAPEGELIGRDLRLARDYALALADYAFWRHPPGILRWLATGTVAAAALQDMRSYAWFLVNMGRQMFFLGRLAEAIQYMKRAQPILDQRDLLGDLAYVFTDLGTTYRVMDEPRRALEHFSSAFDCVAQIGEPHGLATAYMNLGSAYFSMDQHQRALNEHRRALRIALRLQDTHLIASVYNNLGLSLEAMERYPDAMVAYQYALRMFTQSNDQTGVSACYNNLGSVCYASGNLSRAIEWYDLDRKLLENAGAWTDLAATLHNLGHVALEQGAQERALAYFAQSRDLYAAFDLEEYVEEEDEMIRFIEEQQRLAGTMR